MIVQMTSSLAALVQEINDHHHEVEQALTTGLTHAVLAGQKLAEAKRLCQHGQWLPWLRENFEGSERTAQAYMRVARHYELSDGEIRNAVTDLSFRQALRELAEPVSNDTEPVSLEPRSSWIQQIRAVLGGTPGISIYETSEEWLTALSQGESLARQLGLPYEAPPADPYKGWWDSHLVRLGVIYFFRHDSSRCLNCRHMTTGNSDYACMPLPPSVEATQHNLERFGCAVHFGIGNFVNWAEKHGMFEVFTEGGEKRCRFIGPRREYFRDCNCEWCIETREEAPERAHELHIAATGYAFQQAGMILIAEAA